MTITVKNLLESYGCFDNDFDKHADDVDYRKESEEKAELGLRLTRPSDTYSHEDADEYIDGDTKDLSEYRMHDSTSGRAGTHVTTGKPYNKPIDEFNSLIAQPHLTEHQKMRIMGNLIKHNTLVDKAGGGEPHHYATDIQERALFKGYDPKRAVLPKFDDMHDDIELMYKENNSGVD